MADELVERVVRLETNMQNVVNGNNIFRDEVREEIREIRKQNEAIYDIASSVKLMTKEIKDVKDGLNSVKEGQQELSEKLDGEIGVVKSEQGKIKESLVTLEHHEAIELKKTWDKVKEKLIWLFVGGVATFLLVQMIPAVWK